MVQFVESMLLTVILYGGCKEGVIYVWVCEHKLVIQLYLFHVRSSYMEACRSLV
jgi:hypothetical protein